MLAVIVVQYVVYTRVAIHKLVCILAEISVLVGTRLEWTLLTPMRWSKQMTSHVLFYWPLSCICIYLNISLTLLLELMLSK